MIDRDEHDSDAEGVERYRRTTIRPGAPRLGKSRALALLTIALVALPATAVASVPRTLAGSWERLPAVSRPAATASTISVWTGREMLVFGRAQPHPPRSVDVAAAYNPRSRTWRTLAPLPGPTGNFEGGYSAVWTGTRMLVSGPFDFQAFDPRTNRWRRLAPEYGGGAGGLVIWSGRELIDWGGGCCGDASAGGKAYNVSRNTWRTMAPAPLAPSQQPIGAWTGRELIVFVSGIDPDGKPYPAALARAAAYNPDTDTWRRIAPLPAPRTGATAVWDGHEVLVVGGAGAARGAKPAALATTGFAFDPLTNRWRQLPPMRSGRTQAAMAWTGTRLLVWGGRRTAGAGIPATPNRGTAYAPAANRWSIMPGTPLLGRLDPAAVWTGRSLIVWGGQRPKSPLGSGTRSFADGAAFTPSTP